MDEFSLGAQRLMGRVGRPRKFDDAIIRMQNSHKRSRIGGLMVAVDYSKAEKLVNPSAEKFVP